jgi:hypothetical protein
MPMLSANLKILSELKDFITTISNNKLLLQKFSRCEKDFSRNRKLPFTRLAILISKSSAKRPSAWNLKGSLRTYHFPAVAL